VCEKGRCGERVVNVPCDPPQPAPS
jgi:hypothetical protein